jgi:type I restriction enzyme S subunit
MTEGNGEVRELPKGWSKVKLGEILEFEYGKSLTKSLRNESGTFPVLGSSGIVGYHNEYLVEAPVLIIGRKGAVGEVWFSENNCWAIDTTYL